MVFLKVLKMQRRIKKRQYMEALDVLGELVKNNKIKKEIADMYTRLCVHGIATNMYENSLVFGKQKKYDDAIKCLKELCRIIKDSPELFDLDKKTFYGLVREANQEMEKSKYNMKIGDLNSIKKKYYDKAKEVFKDEDKAATVRMFFDSLFMPVVYEIIRKQ